MLLFSLEKRLLLKLEAMESGDLDEYKPELDNNV
jgi:hypothetical protein